MQKNYFKIILRNVRKQKLYAVLNIIGLAVGLTVCLLIGLYVQDDLSYDRFHQDGDQIYRVDMSFIWGDTDERFGSTPPPVASMLQENFPEIASAVRIYPPGLLFFSLDDEGQQVRSFEEERALAVDSTFFNVFTVNTLKGDPEAALKKANTVILTEEAAYKYFGEEEALGRLLTLNIGEQRQTIEVGGIVESLPEQSHFQFDMLLSMPTFPIVEQRSWTWIWTGFVTYVKVKEGTDIHSLEEKVKPLPARYAGSTLERIYGYSFDDYIKQGKQWELFLLPLTDIHLFSENSFNRLGVTGDINYVYLMVTIGLLVLALAIINFVNLSTARAAQRTKEIGVHKVLGSGKARLISLFLLESALFAGVAMLLALALTELLSPFFNQVSGKQLSLLSSANGLFFLLMIGFTAIVSLLAGSYPAFYMASFHPVKALSKTVSVGNSAKAIFMRNGLVAFQFIISIGLIVFTLVIHRQLSYTQNMKLGFSSDNLIILHHAEQIPNEGESWLNQLRQDSRIASVSVANAMPPTVNNEDNFSAYGSDKVGIHINTMVVDAHYLSTLSIGLEAGRNFTEGSTGDRETVILNESAVQSLGWSLDPDSPDFAIGKFVQYPGQLYEVIGITPDFHFQSLRQQVMPLAIFFEGSTMWTGGRKFIAVSPQENYRSASQIQQLIADMGEKWQAQIPQAPFKYSFLDEDYFSQFEAEQRLGKVFTYLAALALFIACMGLYGLMTFVVERKRKEIGIRKVLGASVPQVFLEISSRFTRLILLALLIASPLIWYATDHWLQTFTYRTNIPLWFFLAAGLTVLVISVLSISYQSIRAATANPVDSLRNE
uniref:ABC transporter permease n=1 Tax=Roseihalotalea indica TaxID=2867963 RepID=A0AA49GSS1_9BACT|nr:ABC transporter permease [Tunicatimonas sp. TK19036]